MPILQRANGNLFYDVCDIVPPWQEKETVLFLNGLAIDSDIWAMFHESPFIQACACPRSGLSPAA